MPLTKSPKKREPLWKEWNHKADKRGVRSTIYSVNGDQYTGEWDNNKKNGKCQNCLLIFDIMFQNRQLWNLMNSAYHSYDFYIATKRNQSLGSTTFRQYTTAFVVAYFHRYK